ncbi:MAG TPA: hypothetical protein PKA55_00675 [Rhodoblastus sp.]|nr:hypothetical protein [Rhodoblastus sp.]
MTRIAREPLARLVDQLARALHSQGHEGGLFPAQWTALRYFRDATPPHNTTVALARYQGMAFGPTSRTVRTLIDKRLLRKTGSAGRGRLVGVELTEMGRALLAADPLLVVARALAGLPSNQAEALALACEAILGAIQSAKRQGADDDG